MDEQAKWAREADGPWHRISGFPNVPDTANALCGAVVAHPAETSAELPLDVDTRCYACRQEAERQPPWP